VNSRKWRSRRMVRGGAGDVAPRRRRANSGTNQSGDIFTAKKDTWPQVPKIANADEFQQSFAIAQLAVRLCELRRMTSKIPPEKENLDPKKFLEQAWEFIQNARERVLRPQTNAEYLIAHDGSHDAAENVVERVLSASPV